MRKNFKGTHGLVTEPCGNALFDTRKMSEHEVSRLVGDGVEATFAANPVSSLRRNYSVFNGSLAVSSERISVEQDILVSGRNGLVDFEVQIEGLARLTSVEQLVRAISSVRPGSCIKGPVGVVHGDRPGFGVLVAEDLEDVYILYLLRRFGVHCC